METNKFYLVRGMGKEGTYEVRHSDNPNLVWDRVNSTEEGQERIQELQLDWQADQALTDFLEEPGQKLKE